MRHSAGHFPPCSAWLLMLSESPLLPFPEPRGVAEHQCEGLQVTQVQLSQTAMTLHQLQASMNYHLISSSYYGESDTATEMDLITRSFKKASVPGNEDPGCTPTSSGQQRTEPDSSEYSSQDTTLLAMREQAQVPTETSSRTKKRKVNKRLTRRVIPMREEIFSKIGWFRSFIYGPAEPVHNPQIVWCHVCKKNFSIKSKGPYEILRHHRTERQLRRDQRWRYEHLKSIDPIRGIVQHRVRGGNGKVLSKIELKKGLPRFINVELVDNGERFPLYEDYIKGSTTALVTSESRAKTQLCLVGDFVKTQGDLMVVRKLSSRMGSFNNHQATVTDFDWWKVRMKVSIIFPVNWAL